jgi:nitric oxide dioxygenase
MVSNWLHQNVQVGSILQVSHPFGEFTPNTEDDETIVLLSAGVGVTPMVSSLKRIAAVNPQRRVIFAHAAREASHHALRADVDALTSAMPNLSVVNFYEERGDAQDAIEGRMNVNLLPSWPRDGANVWLCGPHKFMQAQWLSLLHAGVPPARLHREVFGPELLDHLL